MNRLMIGVSSLIALLNSAILFVLLTPSPSRGVDLFSEAALTSSRGNPDRTLISLSQPNISVHDSAVGYANFTVFGLANEPLTMSAGTPALPQVSRFYRIPNLGGVDFNVIAANYEVIDNVYPPVNGESRAPTIDGDAWYPPNVAVMSSPMILRDFRVVTVTLYPVQVNLATHQARIYHNLQAEIVSNTQPSVNELFRPKRPSGAWASIYRSLIANLDESALDDATTTPGTYLILASTSYQMSQWVDSLAMWKRQLGFDVVVDERPNWTASTMQSRIRDLYTNSDPPLEYVALMGDPDYSNVGVPTGGGNYPPGLDHYFALANDGDDLEDVAVGRLSGNTMTAMATINAKLMGYERSPWIQDSLGRSDTLWYHTGVFYYGTNSARGDGTSLMNWGSHQFAEYTGVWNNHVAHYQNYGDEDSLRAWAAQGLAFMFIRGSWIGQISATLPSTLSSKWKLPVVTVIAEATGDFLNQTGLTEAFLTAGTPTHPKGAVCAIGTAWAYSYEAATPLTAGLMYNIANLGVEQIGNCLVGAKLLTTLALTGDTTIAHLVVRSANLMGEPSMRIWTDVPTVMQATYPDTIALGSRSVRVDVHSQQTGEPVQDALAVLSNRDQIFGRALTDDQGTAYVPVELDSARDLMLTISKHNHKPFLATVPCAEVSRYVGLSSYSLDDDNFGGTFGNGDHQPNPTEIIDLPIPLRNYSEVNTATTISATLTTSNPNISILSAVATYPDLLPGDSAMGNVPFRIQISPQMRHHESGLLTLAVTADGEVTQNGFTLICQAGALENPVPHFQPSFDVGSICTLAVALQNTGVLELPEVSAQLISLNPWITVDHPTATYGTIGAGAVVSNSGDPYIISASADAYRGFPAPFMLITTTATGTIDTVRFSTRIESGASTDATGPDAFGYAAFDNTDTGYVFSPVFDYFDITGIGNNLNLNDPGIEADTGYAYSVARRLPFPFRFYDQTYDTITICSNGWCAFGNQSQYGAHMNLPIPGALEADAMIAPYWDDLKTDETGRGVWDFYDSANHRYVIEWKASGASDAAAMLDFEVILLDTNAAPTMDGNGKILIQYQNAVMNLPTSTEEPHNGCTVGITAPRGLVGLQWVYDTTYAPGAASIQAGRAILFSTEGRTRSLSASPTSTVVPSSFVLSQNFPNPFNPTTEIQFDLPFSAHVELTVYNIYGQEVTTLVNQEIQAGSHRVTWDSRDHSGALAASGVYFYQLRTGRFSTTKKMLLIR